MSAKILLVEDNEQNRYLVTYLLEAHGFEVVHAFNGFQAISQAASERPDLILMDVALPGMDGLSATQRLKRDPRTQRIPIVALTAHAMSGDERRVLAAGCAGYITKPIDTRSFPATVTGFL